MPIARLDNEVFFKKAFTDPLVFKAFVRDIVGIDVNPDKIETEKSFGPKVGEIDFKYDIFAEDTARRVIIEIQKVDYDHNFDRFLHYHLSAVTEQQRSSGRGYAIPKTVYTIVLITAPYRSDPTTGEVNRDEVLVSKLNPRNLHDVERKIFNHEIYFLNPNYRSTDTPPNFRDWLELVYESIHWPDAPKINTKNEGVARASELIQFEHISPQEWAEAKIETGREIVLTHRFEDGIQEGENRKALVIAAKLKASGMDIATIASMTGLSLDQIAAL